METCYVNRMYVNNMKSGKELFDTMALLNCNRCVVLMKSTIMTEIVVNGSSRRQQSFAFNNNLI